MLPNMSCCGVRQAPLELKMRSALRQTLRSLSERRTMIATVGSVPMPMMGSQWDCTSTPT